MQGVELALLRRRPRRVGRQYGASRHPAAEESPLARVWIAQEEVAIEAVESRRPTLAARPSAAV